MEQYQYVEGFQRFHTGLRLRCAACLSLQFLLFKYIHYYIHYINDSASLCFSAASRVSSDAFLWNFQFSIIFGPEIVSLTV